MEKSASAHTVRALPCHLPIRASVLLAPLCLITPVWSAPHPPRTVALATGKTAHGIEGKIKGYSTAEYTLTGNHGEACWPACGGVTAVSACATNWSSMRMVACSIACELSAASELPSTMAGEVRKRSATIRVGTALIA